MLQIIIFLGVVHLVFRAKQMILIAWSAPEGVRVDLVKSANRWFYVAVAVGGFFALWALIQGASVPTLGN